MKKKLNKKQEAMLHAKGKGKKMSPDMIKQRKRKMISNAADKVFGNY